MTFNKSYTFSLFEIMLALVIVCLISIPTLKTLSSLKKQDFRIQKFILNELGLVESQIFINKHLSFAKIDSLKITKDSIHGHIYKNLFEAGDLAGLQGSQIMNYSLNTNEFRFEKKDDNLLFNDSLLLSNVKSFEVNLDNSILAYKICMNKCLSDFIILEQIEIHK